MLVGSLSKVGLSQELAPELPDLTLLDRQHFAQSSRQYMIVVRGKIESGCRLVFVQLQMNALFSKCRAGHWRNA